MEIKIDFDENLINKHCEFNGKMEDGRIFVINANWCAGDENWAVEYIHWPFEEGSDEEDQQIIEAFLSEVN